MLDIYFEPKVVDIAVLREISLNMINPLELIREGVSNSSDARASNIVVSVYRNCNGEFIIEIQDDGKGMNVDGIRSFFNIGDSKSDKDSIGEKGLGTKIYYKSNCIIVKTKMKNGRAYEAVMKNPWAKINEGKIPNYTIKECADFEGKNGTIVIIIGYAVDNPEKTFNIDVLKDYIQWFTAGGTFKHIFSNNMSLRKLVNGMDSMLSIRIEDKILNRSENISGVHNFHPPHEVSVYEYNQDSSDNYCRHFGPFHRETNIDGKYVSVQLYGTVSGINCRKEIVTLRKGETFKSRFGLYLCKDFIPFTRRLDLLADEQYYHYHILVNSQNFQLTADRNNVSNESDIYVKWVFSQVKELVNKEIKPIAEREYFKLRKLEDEQQKANNKFISIQKNIKNISKKSNLNIKSIPIVKEPQCEYETVLLFVALLSNKETKIHIKNIDKIVSYSSKMATDLICLDKNAKYSLVEVEYNLSNVLKHKHPIGTYNSVVCWNVDLKEDIIVDLQGSHIVMRKIDDEMVLVYNNEIYIKVIDLKQIINAIRNKYIN